MSVSALQLAVCHPRGAVSLRSSWPSVADKAAHGSVRGAGIPASFLFIPEGITAVSPSIAHALRRERAPTCLHGVSRLLLQRQAEPLAPAVGRVRSARGWNGPRRGASAGGPERRRHLPQRRASCRNPGSGPLVRRFPGSPQGTGRLVGCQTRRSAGGVCPRAAVPGNHGFP